MHRIISTVKSLLFVENEHVLKVSFIFYELKKDNFHPVLGRYFVLFWKITIMNHKIKIALALITGGTLVYLSRKMKSAKNESKTFLGEDDNNYQKNETYFTADGKMYKNGKEVHLKTPEISEKSVNRNFQNDRIQKNYEVHPQNVGYHHKGTRHH
ncbi:hypothetical protein B0E34_09885 [Chryseobacterium mucoviscidosis]|uniref:Uncharacterized protein n=2 Tax=Chryseobacterium mucoviscidosis TaxID=1945581 RepID=A0A202C155_9FLAO|nr:hypothetical protein B0E34_09885 [Chryseobacterium mucoviscidosis]